MTGKLGKLKGRSTKELAERLRQGAAIMHERLGLGRFDSPDLGETVTINSAIFPVLAGQNKFANLISQHEKEYILTRAKRICEDKFDLLGFEGLDFGEQIPDWHFDPTTGKTSPKTHWSRINEVSALETGDKKVIWELNRHQYFVTLGQAYWLTGDERYAEVFVRHLGSWFEENPPKIGVNWLSSLELAFRSISWITAYSFFRGSSAFEADTQERMLKFLYLHARHIETYLSTYFSPNTHLTGEALGLYFIGTFMPGVREASRWKEKGYKILMEMLDVHILGDGSYCEQASHYARYTADFYATLMILRQREGLPIETKHCEKLELLYEYLMHLTQPDGKTPLFGDDDGGKFYFFDHRPISDMRSTLALGAVLFDRGDLKYASGEPTCELLFLLGEEGLKKYNEIESYKPQPCAKAFHNGGVFVSRSSWEDDADHIIIDCGPHGFMNAGHAHADALGMVLSIAGRPLFVDSGTFVYTADLAARDKYRSSAAHNCVTVNGESSSVTDGPFSWKTKANARLLHWSMESDTVHFAGSQDGFERFGVKYERKVVHEINSGFTITDTVDSENENSFSVNFILAANTKVEVLGKEVRFSDPEKPTWQAVLRTSVNGSSITKLKGWSVEEWKISPVYGKQISTQKLVFSFCGKGNVNVLTEISRS
ncbi:MAG: alginate lyase family protein [Acidobacteria bacterium]|nr:alginate lyase family protein [Acidobacteriota bacterium]